MKHLLPVVGIFLSLCTTSLLPAASTDAYTLDSRTGLDAYLHGQYALGDWGGEREKLKEAGVEPFLYYTSNPAGNPSGGIHPGHFTYVDDYWFGLNLDLEKLVGWRGGHFTVSGIDRNGRSLTQRYIGGPYEAQQIYGGQTIFLYQLFLEQEFIKEKLSLKLGRFGASDDFNSSPIYGLYMNSAIDGNIRNVLLDTPFTAYPFSTWAARLNIKPSDEYFIKFGAYQMTQDQFDPHKHGVDFSFHSGDNVFLITEIGWTPEFRKVKALDQTPSNTAAKGNPKMIGMPGHYWIGASYTPWRGLTEFRTGRKVGDSYGFYVNADQMVYRERAGGDEGLIVWVASGYYPQEKISLIPFQINAGLVYRGLFPTRDKDETIIGVAYGRFSRDYAASQQLLGMGNPTYETVLESGYRLHITPFAYIHPNIQYIIRPAGTGRIPNALVLGAQIGVTF